MVTREARLAQLSTDLKTKILLLDGAMGTMIQAYNFTERDYRGRAFQDYPYDIKGNNDLLSLTQPQAILAIHQAYLEAGADIIATNTFNATQISQADYHMEDIVEQLNYEGARLARQMCDSFLPEIKYVAGSLGPTSKTASLSPDVNDPGFRNIDFDSLVKNYKQATLALIKGGVDIILIETIFDTLNAKAAIFAVEEAFDTCGIRLPIMISGTITDKSGRTLSGQTAESFWISLKHANPLSIGFNCALGADELRPHIATLARMATTYVSAYPNAGLPNQFGGYDETPEDMAKHIAAWAKDGLLNVIGGCCGTTPAHIAAFKSAITGVTPRIPPENKHIFMLSGLEAQIYS